LRGEGSNLPTLLPWWRGYNGTVDVLSDGTGACAHGIASGIDRISLRPPDSSTVVISEIPPVVSIEAYKQNLTNMVQRGELQDFTDHCTDRSIHFECVVPGNKSPADLAFNLSAKIKIDNLVLIDAGELRKFESTEKILLRFYEHRLSLYEEQRIQNIALARSESDFKRVEGLEATSAPSLWLKDLERLSEALDEDDCEWIARHKPRSKRGRSCESRDVDMKSHRTE
jgi:hypothetical protein